MDDLISNRDYLRQQLISNQQSPDGGTMSQQEPNTATVQSAIDVPKKNLSDFITGVKVVNFSPYITLTLSPFEHDSLPDEVTLADGNLYSVASPFRKASDGKTPGIVRDALGKIFQEVKQLFSGDLRYIGDTDVLGEKLLEISESMETALTAIIAESNGGEYDFDVANTDLKETNLPASLETEDEELDDGADAVQSKDGFTTYSISDFISVFVYPTVQEDGSIRLTTNINLVVPFLHSVQNVAVNLAKINKIFTTYAEASVGVENFKMLYVLNSDNLLAPNVSKLLTDLADPENDVATVGVPYLRDSIEAELDPFGLYPIGYTLSDAVESLFAYGGDILLVINALPLKK